MDIGSWLRSLGLGQHEMHLGDNAVDAEVLFELSDSDLAQLGVLLGHRKRLLKAVAELASATRLRRQQFLPPSTTAERRPITVMFCDLVGSRVSPRSWTPRTGGTSSTPISTKLRRR